MIAFASLLCSCGRFSSVIKLSITLHINFSFFFFSLPLDYFLSPIQLCSSEGLGGGLAAGRGHLSLCELGPGLCLLSGAGCSPKHT